MPIFGSASFDSVAANAGFGSATCASDAVGSAICATDAVVPLSASRRLTFSAAVDADKHQAAVLASLLAVQFAQRRQQLSRYMHEAP